MILSVGIIMTTKIVYSTNKNDDLSIATLNENDSDKPSNLLLSTTTSISRFPIFLSYATPFNDLQKQLYVKHITYPLVVKVLRNSILSKNTRIGTLIYQPTLDIFLK